MKGFKELNTKLSNKPQNVYYMIHINCQYKARIHQLLRLIQEQNRSWREIRKNYNNLNRDIEEVEERPKAFYKPQKGDDIDELFAYHLNQAQLDLPVKRISKGKYLFGSKQIMAKITGGNLLIRVGGGYMGADEFISHYGMVEYHKFVSGQAYANLQSNINRKAGS